MPRTAYLSHSIILLWTQHSYKHISTGATKEQSGRLLLPPSMLRSCLSRYGLSPHDLTPIRTRTKQKRPVKEPLFYIAILIFISYSGWEEYLSLIQLHRSHKVCLPPVRVFFSDDAICFSSPAFSPYSTIPGSR